GFRGKSSGKERKSPMKNIAVALALVLAGSSLAVGLASTDANAGSAKKICKQEVRMHPMAGTHRALMKQCKAQYKAYKKAGHAPATQRQLGGWHPRHSGVGFDRSPA